VPRKKSRHAPGQDATCEMAKEASQLETPSEELETSKSDGVVDASSAKVATDTIVPRKEHKHATNNAGTTTESEVETGASELKVQDYAADEQGVETTNLIVCFIGATRATDPKHK
jgi:hypothetical protein